MKLFFFNKMLFHANFVNLEFFIEFFALLSMFTAHFIWLSEIFDFYFIILLWFWYKVHKLFKWKPKRIVNFSRFYLVNIFDDKWSVCILARQFIKAIISVANTILCRNYIIHVLFDSKPPTIQSILFQLRTKSLPTENQIANISKLLDFVMIF